VSIDARVEAVVLDGDGGGLLRLVDRPAGDGSPRGCAGQPVLRFDSAPLRVADLVGLNVWGGGDSLMLGEVEIARRKGYTRLQFCDGAKLARAVAAYHARVAARA
jgi:hypothetical protein